ncbi:hypothetical protein GGI19_000527 [Coemansia pectinata]|uniref:Peptidase S59 domain-containing protein n=1 Tax=Coemansia pectinata TaxID=1052879 RepID=A0A9W8H0S3_9FUNG|nr:hypothetical protein GGI19_000527 [Coemansia pectinata]
MSSNTHRPLVINEAKSKQVDVAHASKVLNRLLNQEAGLQSAPSSTIQQLQQLAKAVDQLIQPASDDDDDDMFSSGGAFGSGGGGTNNNTSGFGGFGQSSQNKPTGFGGGTGAFGSTATGSGGGGGFGSGSGIGGFGSTTGATTGGFGSTSNAFGGSTTGAFGGGSSNTFGSGGATTGAFGQQQQQPAATGSTSSLFGGGGGGGAFGSSSTVGGGGGGAFGVSATGTARAPFEPVIEHSATGKKDSFRHICFMNAYKTFSPEELRLEDYEAGRKKADAPGAVGTVGARTGFGGTTTGFGGTTTGGFGQANTGFGQTATSTGGFGQTLGGFGSTGFGQQQQQPASASVGGGFGLNKPAAAAPATGGFGSSSTGGGGFGSTTTGFGQPANTGGGGLFGASKPSAFGQPATTGAATGGFGSSTFGSTTGTTGFGSSGSTGGGGFGSTATGFGQTANTGGGLFGQTSTAATGGFGSSGAGGAFGAKPAFGTTTTTGFGGSAAVAQPAATGGFGQTNTGFGQTSTGFGQTTGGFGQTANTTGSTGGGLFGQTANTAGSTGGGLFGAKPATAGGLFGQQQSTAAAPATGGLFGQSTAMPASSGGLFGQQSTAAPATGGLFGSTGNATNIGGGGLFGAKPAAPATGGLFGTAPAAVGTQTGAVTGGGGLFGSGGGGGLFGSNTTNTAGATAGLGGGGGGGLFGSAAAAPATGGTGLFGSSAGTGGGGGLFGSSTAPAPGASTSLFGFGGQAAQQQPAQQPSMFGMAAQPAQQQPQYAVQIDRQPYGASALFDTTRLAGARAGGAAAGGGGSSHLTATPLRSVPVPRAIDSDRDLQLLKKRGLNLHSLLASSAHVGSGGSVGVSGMSRLRARGFAAPVTVKKPASDSVSSAGTGFLSPEKQLPHSSVKRLTIARKTGFDSAVAAASSMKATPAASATKPPPSFGSLLGTPPQMKSPWANTPLTQSNLSTAGRTPAASRHVAAPGAYDDDESAFAQPPVAHRNDDDNDDDEAGIADGVVEDDEEEENEVGDDEAIEPGEYWMSPTLPDLRAMSSLQLKSVKDFTVGRKNVGQVCFRRPVDLTTVGSLDGIAAKVVLFDDRVCTVYPDESNKPARGMGLNVPADISLENCWPVERSTGEPIKLMDDPRVRKHIKRLRNIEETEFLTFSEGTWSFRVQHFSRYGLDDNQASSDDEDDDPIGPVGANSPTQDFGNATAQHAPKSAQQSPLDSGSRAVADVPLSSSTVDDKFIVNNQRPPRQLLLGARHAESLRRGPVMRASLFATSANDNSQQQQAPPPATTTLFGRIQTQSPAIPVTLPQQQQPQPQQSQARNKPNRNQARRRDDASQVTSATEAAPSVAALDLPPPSKFLRVNETRIARELLSAPQPYAQSLTHGRSGLGADAGLMMARSFRVAFGFQGQLVYLQGSSLTNNHMDDDEGASSKRGRGATSVVVVDSIARHLHAAPGCLEPLAVAAAAASGVDDDSIESIRQRHLDTVRAQYRHSLIAPASPESALCPALSFSAETTIASVLNELSSISNANDGDGNKKLAEEERRILELASVLFDESVDTAMDGDVAAHQRVLSVRRRQALTKWLMSAVHDSVNRDLVRAGASPSPAAASVFALLSGHCIEAACLAATSHRDYRLAMLVAQSGAGAVGGGGNDKQMQALACAQLELIKDDPSLAPAYRRVYELIGGRVRDASAGLDWKRAFALGLWFAQSPADRIADAVSMYEDDALLQPSTRLAPPLPAWLFQGSDDAECRHLSTLPLSEIGASLSNGSVGVKRAAARAADLHRRGVWDPVFQLLKLFSEPAYPLERALLSESFSAARGDSRLSVLLAWLLATIRQSRGFEDAKSSTGVVDSLAYDRLLAGWALQLESLGLWHWACFVLLQMSTSPAHKAHAIRALLDRSMPTSLPTAALSPAAAAAADLLPLCATGQSPDMVDDRIEEQLRFVLDDLCLPRQWLYDALATRSRYDRDWVDVRCYGGSAEIEMSRNIDQQQQHPVLAAAQRQFTASGRPIVRSYFDQFATSATTVNSAQIDMPADTRAAATLRHVVWLLSARQLSAAHTVVLQRIAPDAILRGDYHLLSRVLSHLDPALAMSSDSSDCTSVVPHDEWATGGQVYQAFLAAVDGLPTVLQRIASATTETPFELVHELQRIYYDMRALLTALPSLAARFDALPGAMGFYDGFATEACWYSPEESRVLRVKYSVAVSDMASVISGFVQSLECHAATTMEAAPIGDSLVSLSSNTARADSVALPLAQDVRILRTLQMARTCFDSLVGSELEA